MKIQKLMNIDELKFALNNKMPTKAHIKKLENDILKIKKEAEKQLAVCKYIENLIIKTDLLKN